MNKRAMSGTLTLYPTPAVLVTCKRGDEAPNIITLAWAGVVCSMPPMVGISIQPVRYSFSIINDTGEFVVNMPRADQVKEVDICGVKSGKDVDKFHLCNFTTIPGERVSVPLIQECPVNLECKVKQTIRLGSHFLFLGEVVARHISEEFSYEDGNPIHEKLASLAYVSPHYYGLRQHSLGTIGYSKHSDNVG